ncbi:unnamed protein product [Pleuronectes platessa]|uniref:Uncharacterized protein n=1 Tax=Pleuronectes platessa TaxID=8262 RepID=A0A9N7YQ75_PLEPL|nr:unnamed protein product [Pleuronectes platessa]
MPTVGGPIEIPHISASVYQLSPTRGLTGLRRAQLLQLTRSSSSTSSSSSSSPGIFGNGPVPCQGASLHPVAWLASRESEEGRGQVVESAHPSLRLACSPTIDL